MKAALLLPLLAFGFHAPSLPAEEPAPPSSAPPQIERISDNEFRLGGITFFKDTRKIVFPARLNQDQDPLEYAIVHETGKDHESLLTTAVSPYHLQVVLLLCRYQPHLGSLFDESAPARDDAAPASSGILVTVAWKTPAGEQSVRIEDWIIDLSTGKPMAPGTWRYTGSAVIDRKLQAEVEGSILAIYLDELALVNFPGPRNDDDENWIPLRGGLPPLDHTVTVSFEPAPATPPPAP